MPIRRASVLALVLLAAAALPGCGFEENKGELVYVVTKLDGSAPETTDLRGLSTELNLRLKEAGYARNEVGMLGDGRVRVVLPESVADQLPAIRKILENPDGLRVKLTPTKR